MSKKRPRILRNRCPKRINLRPLMQVPSAAHTAAQLMREFSAASKRVEAHIRACYIVARFSVPFEGGIKVEMPLQWVTPGTPG